MASSSIVVRDSWRRPVEVARRIACAGVFVLLVSPMPPVTATGQARAMPRLLADASDPADATRVVPAVLAHWQVHGPFDEVIARMWEASPTFRRQCRRLAAAAPPVRLQVRQAREPDAFTARAHTKMHWEGGAIASATMFVPVTGDVEELIAHELEHVLEQVDHVDLEAHLPSGAAWRYRREGYETRRAVEAGRRVARELAESRHVQGLR